jgi:uncharacterized protein
MESRTGTPVEGDNFFGREKELIYAWKRINTGNNLIFPSPRRVGKTSFALKLIEIAKEEDWQVISINLEKITSEKAFIESFIEELKKSSIWETVKEKGSKLFDFIKQIKHNYEYEGVKISLEWQSEKEDIYKQLADLLDHEKEALIFMDELTVLLSHMINQEDGHRNVSFFLHWMRELRIKSGSKIRWIFCSSVGIENFTHTHRISATMNDMSDYFLKPFDDETSKAMLRKLAERDGLDLSIEIQEAIVQKLSFCLPYFLQIMFEKITYLFEVEELTLNTEIVEIAYKSLINEKHFNTWDERIQEQYAELSNQAFALLKHICQENQGSKRENLINVLSAQNQNIEEAESAVAHLLYMLKNDGYLMEANNLYLFRSPLLRDFWFNRFAK